MFRNPERYPLGRDAAPPSLIRINPIRLRQCHLHVKEKRVA
jgi:hypothetical protein